MRHTGPSCVQTYPKTYPVGLTASPLVAPLPERAQKTGYRIRSPVARLVSHTSGVCCRALGTLLGNSQRKSRAHDERRGPLARHRACAVASKRPLGGEGARGRSRAHERGAGRGRAFALDGSRQTAPEKVLQTGVLTPLPRGRAVPDTANHSTGWTVAPGFRGGVSRGRKTPVGASRPTIHGGDRVTRLQREGRALHGHGERGPGRTRGPESESPREAQFAGCLTGTLRNVWLSGQKNFTCAFSHYY